MRDSLPQAVDKAANLPGQIMGAVLVAGLVTLLLIFLSDLFQTKR